MGKPMALNLIKSGYELVVYDINSAPVRELVAAGAEDGGSIKELASRCKTIITMLPNSPQVREVVAGEGGIIQAAVPGTLIIDMSSIAPLVSIEMEKKAGEAGLRFMDAPVSGGEPKAIDGSLSIMVGGSEEDFNEAFKLLSCMGKSVVRVGDIGSGNTAKLANQVVVALNIAAVSEAFVLATKAGVDPGLVYNAIRSGLAGSTVMDAKVPMMLEGNFKPGFKIDLHIKDLKNAMETANEIGAPLMLTEQALQILTELKENGDGMSDHSAIVKYYEKLAKVEVRKK